ncbi:MAG: adenylyltransferase/cytidyltransferase family protein [bacterium]|nr:adenylyltransferase/cytidyltransferase family protein [bacterium]
MKIVVASGYFNPIHIGHLKYLRGAKKLGDKLIVIVNNDEQVKLKGSAPFMIGKEKFEIVKAIKWVDEAVLSIDKHRTVIKTLEKIKPNIFTRGGDLTPENVSEVVI